MSVFEDIWVQVRSNYKNYYTSLEDYIESPDLSLIDENELQIFSHYESLKYIFNLYRYLSTYEKFILMIWYLYDRWTNMSESLRFIIKYLLLEE